MAQYLCDQSALCHSPCGGCDDNDVTVADDDVMRVLFLSLETSADGPSFSVTGPFCVLMPSCRVEDGFVCNISCMEIVASFYWFLSRAGDDISSITDSTDKKVFNNR